MRTATRVAILFCLVNAMLASACAKDDAARVREAAKRSTLDQPGTPPFHLKAVLAPSLERDRDSGRSGEVEYWWESPTRFRREVRSPQFHQIEIVDGDRRWQKNEGDYYPNWLREIAVALVRPLPSLDQIIAKVEESDVKRMMGSTYYQWSIMSSNGTVEKGMGATVALTDSTGLLFYGGGNGWGALYKNYEKFHNRVVGRTVSGGTPEVTARIVVLEDLKNAPDSLFDTQTPGADAHPIDTLLIDELSLRKNLVQAAEIAWPPVKTGPVQGLLTTEVIVDRQGNVRDTSSIVGDNPAVSDAARQGILAMRFTPFLLNGEPVQVISRITMSFKTARPGEASK